MRSRGCELPRRDRLLAAMPPGGCTPGSIRRQSTTEPSGARQHWWACRSFRCCASGAGHARRCILRRWDVFCEYCVDFNGS